jgi:hypothetical protein
MTTLTEKIAAPRGLGIVEVSGFDDAKVARIVKELRETRSQLAAAAPDGRPINRWLDQAWRAYEDQQKAKRNKESER